MCLQQHLQAGMCAIAHVWQSQDNLQESVMTFPGIELKVSAWAASAFTS